MNKRVIEVGSDCKLTLSNDQLFVHRGEELVGKAPLEDVGVLILDNPLITYSLQLLQFCADHDVAVLFCNEKHMPSSLLQPMTGHSLHSKMIAKQIAASEPTKKRLWQMIIVGKLRAQALTLERVGVDSGAILRCAENVKSGDSDNQESQAAAMYWRLLFGEAFRRDPDLEGVNTLLNYAYAVVRAAVARSISGTGLHPAIGLHHHNQYDAFCLADDLMEPFRPAVDLLVFRLAESGAKLELDRDTKRKLLTIFESRWQFAQKKQPFFVTTTLYAAAVKRVLIEDGKKLEIPQHCDGGDDSEDEE